MKLEAYKRNFVRSSKRGKCGSKKSCCTLNGGKLEHMLEET